MTDSRPAVWIGADWGTSHLRAWSMGADGAVLQAADSAAGMRSLRSDEFEAALLTVAGGWLDPGRMTPVVICGMAGAREGWRQAPYADLDTPLAALAARAVAAPTADPRIAVRIMPGLKQAGEYDVMRGEETQLVGLLHGEPGFSGLVCLPGTHSKWARIDAGRIAEFHTYMTGELYDTLREHTILRHSLGGAGWSDHAFEMAVADAFKTPLSAPRRLFGLRAASLIAGLGEDEAKARLSGYLIGGELADALATAQGSGPILLLGETRLSDLYARALAVCGYGARIHDVTEATLDGLRAAYATLKEDFHAGA